MWNRRESLDSNRDFLKNKAISRFKSLLHRELVSVNTLGSNVIFGGLFVFAAAGFIVITSPQD